MQTKERSFSLAMWRSPVTQQFQGVMGSENLTGGLRMGGKELEPLDIDTFCCKKVALYFKRQ